jgi:hypothetical protein
MLSYWTGWQSGVVIWRFLVAMNERGRHLKASSSLHLNDATCRGGESTDRFLHDWPHEPAQSQAAGHLKKKVAILGWVVVCHCAGNMAHITFGAIQEEHLDIKG